MQIIFLVISLFIIPARSETCDEKVLHVKNQIYQKFQIEKRRQITEKILSKMNSLESVELKELSRQFNLLPHTPENANEKYALQNQARSKTREYTQRAGYRLLNPPTANPYDALIEQTKDRDGFAEFSVEVRSLLILADPLPHATLWVHSQNTAKNPWKIVSIGIREQAPKDYASWMTNHGRATGSIDDLARSYLGETCSY